MDDRGKPVENQSLSDQNKPTSIFQIVEEKSDQNASLKPEEISPDIVFNKGMDDGSEPPPENKFLENNKTKYLLIGISSLVFAIVFVLFLRLILGGNKKEAVSQNVVLTYWGLWDEDKIIAPLIAEYQAKNKNVKISYTKMAPQDYKDKLIVRSKAGEGPDIFRFHNTWLSQLKEITAPLADSVMPSSEFEKTFYPVHQRDLKVGDYYYGIPLMIDGLVLVYNDNLFKKAGISTVPLTWEDIIDFGARLTVKSKEGQIITSGIALGTASNIEHFSDILGLFILQNGGDIKKLDQPEAVGALESYRKFAEAPNNFWDLSMPNSIVAFVQEKVAMMMVPSWQIISLKNQNPELKLKVTSVPIIPGSRPISVASYWVEGVSRFSKNQKEAWKFLRFLAEKENQTKIYENQSKLRIFGQPYSRVDLGPVLSQNEYLGPVIKQANSFVSIPTISKTYDSGLNDEINKYLENAINQTIQGVSYDQAFKTAKQGVDQVFQKYKIQ